MGRLSGGCREVFWKVWGGCLEAVSRLSGGFREAAGGFGEVVWRV